MELAENFSTTLTGRTDTTRVNSDRTVLDGQLSLQTVNLCAHTLQFVFAICSSMYEYILRSAGSMKQIVCPKSLRQYN
jgi:hypothetical protein